MESMLRIEGIQLEDEGSYSCATRLNGGGVSMSANKTIIVLSNEKDEGMICVTLSKIKNIERGESSFCLKMHKNLWSRSP